MKNKNKSKKIGYGKPELLLISLLLAG